MLVEDAKRTLQTSTLNVEFNIKQEGLLILVNLISLLSLFCKKLGSGLSLFYEQSKANNNWHKSCVIWLYDESHPSWCTHPNFTWEWAQGIWLFQIGFNIPPKTMIASIIHSIQQKLIHWSSKKLSLAWCVIMANQVLLVTSWYNLSWWPYPKQVYIKFNDSNAITFGQLRKIMRQGGVACSHIGSDWSRS